MNIYQAANAVPGAGEMETKKELCCLAGPQYLLEETAVNTVALWVYGDWKRGGKGAVAEVT